MTRAEQVIERKREVAEWFAARVWGDFPTETLVQLLAAGRQLEKDAGSPVEVTLTNDALEKVIAARLV